jgi:hypothetical protein
MSQAEQQYLRAREAWVTARKNYKRALNVLGMQQQRTGDMGPGERGFEWHFNYAYSMYRPVAQRYLQALKAYARERPELTGRLMYDHLHEAALAQWSRRDDVSDRHLKSVEMMAVESVKVAHADWVKNGNKETMAAVFLSIADAQLMNADRNPQVKGIAQEVFDLYQQGKVKRDPGTIQVTPTPKVPSVKKRRQPGPALWIHKTIEY